MVDAGLIYDFLKLLEHSFEEIKFEALWCLTNIASSNSDHVISIVMKDGISKILHFVDSEIIEIQAQVIKNKRCYLRTCTSPINNYEISFNLIYF